MSRKFEHRLGQFREAKSWKLSELKRGPYLNVARNRAGNCGDFHPGFSNSVFSDSVFLDSVFPASVLPDFVLLEAPTKGMLLESCYANN